MGAVRHMVPDLQAYVMALTTVGREVISWEMVTMALAPTAREALRIRDDYGGVTTERDVQGYYLLPGDGFSANAEDLTDQVLRATGREYTPEQMELCLGELVKAPRPQRGGSRRVTRGKLAKTRGGLVQFDAELIQAYPSAIEEKLMDCLLESDVYLEREGHPERGGVMRISLGTARLAASGVPGDTAVCLPMRQIFYAHRWGTISTPSNLVRLVTKARPVHPDTGVVTMPLCEYIKMHAENTERALRRRAMAERVPDVECTVEAGNVAEAMDRFRQRLLRVMDSLPVYVCGPALRVSTPHRRDAIFEFCPLAACPVPAYSLLRGPDARTANLMREKKSFTVPLDALVLAVCTPSERYNEADVLRGLCLLRHLNGVQAAREGSTVRVEYASLQTMDDLLIGPLAPTLRCIRGLTAKAEAVAVATRPHGDNRLRELWYDPHVGDEVYLFDAMTEQADRAAYFAGET